MKISQYIRIAFLVVSLMAYAMVYCYSQKKIITIIPETALKECKKCSNKVQNNKSQTSTDSLANVLLDCIVHLKLIREAAEEPAADTGDLGGI